MGGEHEALIEGGKVRGISSAATRAGPERQGTGERVSSTVGEARVQNAASPWQRRRQEERQVINDDEPADQSRRGHSAEARTDAWARTDHH